MPFLVLKHTINIIKIYKNHRKGKSKMSKNELVIIPKIEKYIEYMLQ